MQNVWPNIRPSFYRWLPVLCFFLGFHLWLLVVSMTIENHLLERLNVVIPWGLASLFFLAVGLLLKRPFSHFLIFPLSVLVPHSLIYLKPLSGGLAFSLCALVLAHSFLGILYMRGNVGGPLISSILTSPSTPKHKRNNATRGFPLELIVLSAYSPILFLGISSMPFFYAPIADNMRISFGQRWPHVTSLALVIGAGVFFAMHQLLTQKSYAQYKKNFPVLRLQLDKRKETNNHAIKRMIGLGFAIVLSASYLFFSRTP